MWQPPTSPGAGTPAGGHPQPDPNAPTWDASAPAPAWDASAPAPAPWAQGPGSWPPPPGTWPPPPGTWWPQPGAPAPRRPRSRKALVAIVAACVLGAVVLGAAVVGAFAVGRAAADRSTSSAGAAQTAGAPVDPTGLGNDPALDADARACHDGDMQACDDLYERSEPMSRYEQYGMTCGGRLKSFDVEFCTDLD